MIRFGVFEFNPETGDLWKTGRRTRLQDQARRVLQLLLERPGELVSREELRRRLWPDDTFVDFDTGLNVVITKIRQALGDSASTPRFIETLPRRGYRFIAPIASDVEPIATAPVAAAVPESAPAGLRRWRWAAALGVVGALALAGLPWIRRAGGEPAAPAIRAVAVLPLENLSGDEAQTYLVDGIAEALTTDLASIRSLRVVPRQSTKQYRGTTRPASEIGRALNVDALIGGSVSRSGDRIQLTVQLIDAAGDRNLWARSFAQDRRDILRLQRDAAQELARAMRVTVTAGERARLESGGAAANADAYDAYLRGRYHLAGLAETEAQTARALEEFQRAVEIDPNFALGYAGIAIAQQLRSTVYQGRPPSELRAPAIRAARRALALDPSLGEAHAILARVQLSEFDWPGAEQSFQRAADLGPVNGATLVWQAYQLIIQGRVPEAIEMAERAERLDPLDLNTRIRVAFIHTLVRQPDQSRRRYAEILALDPDRAIAKWFLSTSYYGQARYDEILPVLSAAMLRHGRTPAFLSQYASLAGRAGRTAEARGTLEELLAVSRREYVSPALLAMAHTGLGDRARAFEWFERAYEERSNLMMYFAVHPVLDPLRGDPRYVSLAARIARPHAVRE